MTALVGLFGNTEYIRELIGGQNVLLFCCAFVGINAVCEMAASTMITGAVGSAFQSKADSGISDCSEIEQLIKE